jgi:PBP1b-binding outer membrane lipoprotein LpoB
MKASNNTMGIKIFRRTKVNNNRIPFILTIVLVLAVFLGGCAKPPTEEMDAAQAALTRAENDPDAVAYGSPSIIRARDALANMRTDAAAKRYDSAKTFAQDVVNAAERAIADGKAGAQRARDEATNLLNGVRTGLGETEKNIAAAQGKNIPLDFNSINGDFNTAKTQADQAQTSLNGADYQGSIQKSQSARSILGSIDNRLTQSSIATSRKK